MHLHAPSILLSFIRSHDDIAGGQQVLWRSTAGLRTISHILYFCFELQCNYPVEGRVDSIVIGHYDSIPGRGRGLEASGPALGNDQPRTQYVPRLGGRGMKLTSRFNLVPRVRISTAIPSLPHTSSWCSQGQLYALGIFLAFSFRVVMLLKSPALNLFNVTGKQF
jgi:hypothetical protein